ncbi:hypothetical protein [Micromonospora parva]|uniref:hypothetical protein n=1 Tax=Micromonospora parva TaxID=1464048 RepID=UPI00364D64E3
MHADQVRRNLVVDEIDRPEVFLNVPVDGLGEALLRPLRRYEPVMQRLMTEDS